MPAEPYWEVMAFKEFGAGGGMAGIVGNVGGAATGIVSSLLQAAAGATLDTLSGNVSPYVYRLWSIVDNMRAVSVEDMYIPIADTLVVDWQLVIGAIKAGIAQGVGGVHASLFEQISGLHALSQAYYGMIKAIGLDPYLARWANDHWRPNIPNAEAAWFMYRIGVMTEANYKNYLHQNGWDDTFKDELEGSWIRQPPIDSLLEMYRRKMINWDTLAGTLKWYRFTDDMVNRVGMLAVQYPEPYRLAEMMSKAIISTEAFTNVMGIFGLEPAWSDAWAEAQLRFPDFGTALALLRRGDIDDATFTFWMQRNQIPPEVTDTMLKLRTVIPPIDDLIRFAVREAYLDHDPEKQYSEMVSWAGKMGLSAESTEHYWYAHWTRIPVGLMFDNYRRGLWDVAKLEHMLKIADIHPDDRQDIINVAYLPPSIREMGYGWDVGVYTEADIERFRRWGGLSPADAKKATEAMVAYRTEAERNSVRTELMYAFGDERIDEEAFIKGLKELTTPEAAISLWVTRAHLYHDRAIKPTTDLEGRTVSGSEALTAFKIGIIDEDKARELLRKLFWTDERINIAIDRAIREKAKAEAEAKEVKPRDYTIAQMTNLFNYKLITKDQFTEGLKTMGYTAEAAKLLTEVYTKPKAPIGAVKNYTVSDARKLYNYQIFNEDDIFYNYTLDGYTDEQAGLLTLMTKLDFEFPILARLYEGGYINTEQIMTALKKIGMDEFHAKLLIDKTQYEYQVSRLAKEKDLTKAEILKGAKNMVLTLTQAADLLQGIGYDKNEAYYLLAINKVVAAGDPDGYWEMRRVTEQYKKARGEKWADVPDELISLEAQQKRLKARLEELKKTPEKEQEISDTALELNRVEQRMRQIIIEKGL